MQKEVWRNNWLSCMNELTSIELQSKSWLDRSNTNPHWSYVEFICNYFDYLKIGKNFEYQLKNNWISKEEYSLIIKWHTKLDKYESPKGRNYDNEAILKDEKWRQIVEEGNNVKKELGKILSPSEFEILNEEIDYWNYL